MPKKDYVKRDITLVGRTKPNEDGDKECEVCQEADQFLSNATKHDNRITYHKIEVDTEEGRQIAEDEDVKGLPYIKDCRTFEPGGKPRCREIEGFSAEDDFSDLNELIEKKEESKAEEEAKKEEPEPEIKEPVEPSEPK